MTEQTQVAVLTELVNVASSCVPCDSGSGSCNLHHAVNKALPAINLVLHEKRLKLSVGKKISKKIHP